MDDPRLATHARAHHGVFDHRQLDALGIGTDQRRRNVDNGRWQRLHEGVFAASTTPRTFELELEAALAAMPAAALSHRAAALALGLGELDQVVEISVEPGRRNRLAGVRVHQTPLPADHVTRRSGWRVTTVERTLIDLGKVVSTNELQRCIEDAVTSRRTTMARVESTFAELAVRGRPGIARTRSVLARLDGGPPSESELEARFWRTLVRARLPLPLRQHSFEWLAGGSGRVDLWYPAHRLIVELDGRRFHTRSGAFDDDRRRDQLALVHGLRTVRFTHRQVTAERRYVTDVMRRLLTR